MEIHFTFSISVFEQPKLKTVSHPSLPREVLFVRVALFYFSFCNFVIEMVMKLTLSSCKNSDIDISPYRKVFDLEYADDVLLNKDPCKF